MIDSALTTANGLKNLRACFLMFSSLEIEWNSKWKSNFVRFIGILLANFSSQEIDSRKKSLSAKVCAPRLLLLFKVRSAIQSCVSLLAILLLTSEVEKIEAIWFVSLPSD